MNMSLCTPDYSYNGLATSNLWNNILNCSISVIFVLLCFTPTFLRFKDFILDRTLFTFQYLFHLRNIFYTLKEYYSIYKQLWRFCQDTFLETYGNHQAKLWKVLARYHQIPDHFHNLKTTLQADFDLLKTTTTKISRT